MIIILQADFQVIEKYKPGLPLHVGVGICGFGAIDDKRYLPTQMEAWAECAIDKTKNFRLHWLTGGHSYVTKNPDALLAFLAKDLEGLARWEPLPTK